GHVARGATGLALHRGRGLALALLGRLLVVLALAGFGEDAGLLAGALEATEGKLERLVFADFDAGHTESRFGLAARSTGEPRIIAMEVWLPQAASECPRGAPPCTRPWGSPEGTISLSRPIPTHE